ncbi:MAG: NYN domain-containing protein [Planctomycetota bacterium]
MEQLSAAAVFVDFDNLFYGLLNGFYNRFHKRSLEESLNLLAGLRAHLRDRDASIVLGRAYSSFDEYPGSEAAHPLALMGYDPQYVVQHKGKNSADLSLSLDLMEVLLTRSDIELFVIVGGDRDFIPVARKVLEARRELLIVALPQVTSGDLIDRVGPERFMDAGRLIAAPETDARAAPMDLPHLADLEPRIAKGVMEGEPEPAREAATESVLTPVPTESRGARILGRIDLQKTTSWTPLSDAEAQSDERQSRCLELILQMANRLEDKGGSAEVWLSPFLKNEMVDSFPHLTHPQRRRLVNLLKEQDKIRVEERESQTGPFPYSVVIVNQEHPDVVAMLS